MRLIDADALDLDREVEMADDWNTAHEIANCVKYAPTIDAVPVVRCSECKYAYKSSVPPLVFCGNGKGLVDPRPDSFCSYGERKEDSNETN